MKIRKYRRDIQQKGSWVLPDTWKGPFSEHDEIGLVRGKQGWELEVEFYRNDGDDIVVLNLDRNDKDETVFARRYPLPSWLSDVIEILCGEVRRETKDKIRKAIECSTK
jgi:hypothetical protein